LIINKSPSPKVLSKPTSEVRSQSAPPAPAAPSSPPVAAKPLARPDTFVAQTAARGPDLGGAALGGKRELPKVFPGTSFPAHLLRMGGQVSLNSAGQTGGVQEAGTPTPVRDTLPPLTDPREGPVDLSPYLLLAAEDPDAALAALEDLRASAQGDEQLMRYVETLERALLNPTYQEWAKEGATISLTTSAGNGGEPVMVLAPPGFDPNESLERPVHTHYHGLGSPVAGDAAMEAEINDIWSSTDPAPIFILPEAITVTSDVEGAGNEWRTHGGWPDEPNVELTTQDGLSAVYGGPVEEGTIGERVVSAHSRGGAALTRSIMADPDSLQADRLLLLDCLYMTEQPGGDRLNASDDVDPDEELRDWLRDHADSEQVGQIIVVGGSYPDASTSPLLAGAGDSRITPVDVDSHDAALTDGMDQAFP
jgi:hypothetical protein